MSATLVSFSAPVIGTTTATGTSSGSATGDHVILLVANKLSSTTPATPSGWTLITSVVVNSGGTDTGNQGPIRLTAFTREVSGTLTIPAIANGSGTAQVIGVSTAIVRLGAGETISIAFGSDSDTDGNTAWSVNAGSSLGLTADDLVLLWSAMADNAATVASPTFSATGITTTGLTERADVGTGNGNDMAIFAHTVSVASGTATGNAIHGVTLSQGIVNQTVGGTLFIRVRGEISAVAPTVNAGADASVFANNLFSRTATEDDGGAAITSRAWTIQSGPSGVGTTIGTAAALSWTPTVAGTYVLRYSATNLAGTGTDDVTVTVNGAPTVNAGADASVVNREPFSRTATESGSGITARQWKIQSGPAGVNDVLDTDAVLIWTPTVPGTYVLRYSATNAAGTTTDDVQVVVVAVVVNVEGTATGQSDVSAELFRATTLSETVSSPASAVADALSARVMAVSVTATAVATASLARVTRHDEITPASATGLAALSVVVRVEVAVSGDSVATGDVLTSTPLSGTATAGSDATSSALRVRLLDAPTLTALATVVQADLAAPSGGKASARAIATGDLLQIKSVSGTTTAVGTANLTLSRVTRIVAEAIAESVALGAVTTVARYENSVITADSLGSGTITRVQLESEQITGQSFASADYMVGVTGVNGFALAVASVVDVDILPITGLREAITATAELNAPLQRAAVVKSVAEAVSSVTFTGPLVRLKKFEAPTLVARGTLGPITAQRTVVFHPQLAAVSVIPATNLTVVTDFGNIKITAVSSVRERSVRIVITTATAHGEVPESSTRAVVSVSGFMVARSLIAGNLIWAPIKHFARARSSADGGLVALKLLSEELRGRTTLSRDLRAARALSSIIGIMDDYGNFVPVDRTGHYELSQDDEEEPVVFGRPFMLMRQ